MTQPVIPTLPDAPQRGEAFETFTTKANAFVASLANWTTKTNELGTWTGGRATAAANSATAAAGSASAASSSATAAAGSATAAANSAQTAVAAPGTVATSTTELTIGTGSKTLTVQPDKVLVVGMSVKIAHTAAPATWMHGDVTSYNPETGQLIVNVTNINGSGTQSAWTVSISGPVLTLSFAQMFAGLDASDYTYSAGNLTEIEYTTGNKQVFGYTSGNLTSISFRDTDGTTVLATLTLAYTDGNLTSTTWS